jgi:hypothetical protein
MPFATRDALGLYLSPVPIAYWGLAVAKAILGVVSGGTPIKIGRNVVCWVVVSVTNKRLSFWWRPIEHSANNSMNANSDFLALMLKPNTRVALADVGLQHPLNISWATFQSARYSLYPTHIGHGISRKIGYDTPLFGGIISIVHGALLSVVGQGRAVLSALSRPVVYARNGGF